MFFCCCCRTPGGFFAYMCLANNKKAENKWLLSILELHKTEAGFPTMQRKKYANKTMRQRINIYNIENETAIITIYQMFPILPNGSWLKLLLLVEHCCYRYCYSLFFPSHFRILCIKNWLLPISSHTFLLTLSLSLPVCCVCSCSFSHHFMLPIQNCVCVRYVLFYFLDVTLFKCK